MSTDCCPKCGEMDGLDCHDMDVQSTEILSYHSCTCGASWTCRWSNLAVEDLEVDECDDQQDIIDDDNRQRAEDMNHAMR